MLKSDIGTILEHIEIFHIYGLKNPSLEPAVVIKVVCNSAISKLYKKNEQVIFKKFQKSKKLDTENMESNFTLW